MVSMAFYGLMIYWIFKKIQKPVLRWSLCTVLAIGILGVGISRVYLGVHYASDIIGAFCISTAYLVCFVHLIERRKEGEPN